MTDTKPNWKNRIVGHGSKPADQFLAHPNNPRKHPQAQRDALRGSLDTLGWVQPVLENVRTGHLIDGHERIWQALAADNAEVPYIQVDLSPEEESQALLSLDFIAAMAETDKANMDELLRSFNSDNADVQTFLAGLAQENTLFALTDGIDPLKKFDMEGNLANERIIIIFNNSERKLIEDHFGKPLTKIVYKIEELIPK